MNDTLGLRQVYATRYARLKPEIRTRYVPHYLPRYASLRTSLRASLRTSLRTPGVVGSLQGQADVAEQRRGAARHSEAQRVQRCTEMRRECREFLRASETVRERHSSARLHVQWKGVCLAAICCVCCRLSSSARFPSCVGSCRTMLRVPLLDT